MRNTIAKLCLGLGILAGGSFFTSEPAQAQLVMVESQYRIVEVDRAENRIGIVSVSSSLHEAFSRYLRYVAGASIVAEQYNHEKDSTDFMILCPDFRPVKDGTPTPRYTMVVTEDSNVISWVLDKSFEL